MIVTTNTYNSMGLFSGRKEFEFVAIGETTMDAFIRLENASVHCDINKENCQLCVDFGAKIPYESAEEIPAVGNAANAAVSAARLGLRSALVANVGKDENGIKCISSLKKDGVDTSFVGVQSDKATNYHYVLWYEMERTILQKHSEFVQKLPNIGEPKWVYLTSLGEHTLDYHKEIGDYLAKHPKVKMAFQPGIFQIKFGKDKLRNIYQNTEVFFCNVEESRTILGNDEHDIKNQMKAIASLGPKKIYITDGIKGAYAYDSLKPDEAWFMPVYPHEPFERTGAGDAFASTVISALALGKNVDEALMWGPINSMTVVQQVGAQKGLLTRAALEEYLSKAPSSYKPEKI
jgi:ribokinase